MHKVCNVNAGTKCWRHHACCSIHISMQAVNLSVSLGLCCLQVHGIYATNDSVACEGFQILIVAFKVEIKYCCKIFDKVC